MSFGTNKMVKWLLMRSYGQGGTVALPVNEDFGDDCYSLVKGDFPPGVMDVIDHLVQNYKGWSSSGHHDVEWCFLVGGPGNGKSEALRSLSKELGIDLPRKESGKPTPRTIPVEWPKKAASIPGVSNLRVVFINDASIPRESVRGEKQNGSLFHDIQDSLTYMDKNKKEALTLFGNINRGVLIEECALINDPGRSNQKKSEKIAGEIIQWLSHPPENLGEDKGREIETLVPIARNAPYYGQFRIPTSGIQIKVHVVFLDTLSLLEPSPVALINKSIDFSGDRPKPASYLTFGGLSNENRASREETVAGKILSCIVEPTKWEDDENSCKIRGQICDGSKYCPFINNSKWLNSILLRRRFLDLIRAAEITASRRFSYRDLLGYISLAVIGIPEHSWLSGTHPCDWVKEQQSLINHNSKSAITLLLTHRVYSNLFPSTNPTAWKKAAAKQNGDSVYGVAIQQMTSVGNGGSNNAFEVALNKLDPSRAVNYQDFPKREQVLDAIEAMEIKGPTLSLLEDEVLLPEANTSLEGDLDKVLLGEIDMELAPILRTSRKSNIDASRRVVLLRKWRSTLLLRQVGLSMGWFNFKDVIGAWLSEQYNALHHDASLELGKGIRQLLIPSANNQDALIFAPIRPRIYNFEPQNIPANTMLVRSNTNDLVIQLFPRGDNLVAEISQPTIAQQSPVKASIVIDLSIAREALLRSRAGSNSFTEIGSSAFSRIERVRALLVGRERLKQGSVYFTDDSGSMYRLVPSLSGKSKLSVMKE